MLLLDSMVKDGQVLSFIINIIFTNFLYGITILKTHTVSTTASDVKDDISTFHSQTSLLSNKACSVCLQLTLMLVRVTIVAV